MRTRPTVAELVEGLDDRDPVALARAITLTESARRDDRAAAQTLLDSVLSRTGNAVRIGISGVPGVGKSTFIDQFGLNLVEDGHRVAVLAVDPTSSRTGGSILGDKTRMERLSQSASAFIRPSPAGRTLGGVTGVTRESMLLCEAAGYDTILVETVGVGQSETAVQQMVDHFVVLMLPGAGDDLQGIKKGIIELADLLVVNKADGAGQSAAALAATQYRQALHMLAPSPTGWSVPVLQCSALQNEGLDQVWAAVLRHRDVMTANGEFEARRARQRRGWMWELLEAKLRRELDGVFGESGALREIEERVGSAQLGVGSAVETIWARFVAAIGDPDHDKPPS